MIIKIMIKTTGIPVITKRIMITILILMQIMIVLITIICTFRKKKEASK